MSPAKRKQAMERVTKTFMTGAVVAIPIIATLYVIWATAVWMDGMAVAILNGIHKGLGDRLEALTVPGTDVPMHGVGMVLILGMIFLVGLAGRFWLSAWILRMVERVLERVPLVKTVYTAIRDMLRFFGGDSGEMGKVVLYRPAELDMSMLAILTNEHPIGPPPETVDGRVAIWLPMSYMLGGYMLYVPRETLTPIDMSVENLMKLTTTAEVGAEAIIRKRHKAH